MTERKTEHCKPHYKNEVSIFEKEILQKLEEFRAARSNWVTSYTNQTTNTNTIEGFYKSDVYKGRCVCLRRIGFKTTFLRVHHKSLRPLKYYTCKRKLPDIDAVRTESEEKLLSLNDETHARLRFKRKFFLRTGRDAKKKKSKEATYSCTKLSPQNEPDFFKEEIIEKKKSKWRRKKKQSEDQRETKSGLSKKAIQKLKAAQLESGVVESCKCDDGKELTVVIKGFCFCDKNSLNKLKLDKVRDEYSKMASNLSPANEQKLPPRLTNALEASEKLTAEKFLMKKDKQNENEDGSTLLVTDSKKSLQLETPKHVEKITEKLNPEDTSDSTVTLFKNLQQTKSNMGLTEEQFKKMREASKKK